MTIADLSLPEPVLQVQDLRGTLDELSKQISPPEGGILRGEVLATFGGGARVQLRDAGRALVELRLEQPLRAVRGDWVEVLGAPELVAEAVPLGLRVVWRGNAAKHLGVSRRFRERRAFAEQRAASLPFATPRISARLRSGGRLRVVSVRHSRAWEAVEEAARQYRWLKPDARYCEDLRNAGALATLLTTLKGAVSEDDVVLVARDVGEMADLDLFEDQRVVGALAKLTERCPTILAVGQAGDELLTNKVVTYPVETASAALQLIIRESGARPIEAPGGAGLASPGEEETELAAPGPAHAPPSSSPRGWLRWLLLGAAAYLGWWSRGFQAAEDSRAPAHTVSATVASESPPR